MKLIRASSLALLVLGAVTAASVSAQDAEKKPTRILPQRANPVKSDYIPPAPPIAPPSTNAAPPPVAPAEISKSVLVFDNELQEATVKTGTAEARFTFNLTNISTEEITITSVHTSCGCTVAQLPPLPWMIAPGTNGQVNVTMNLASKSGIVFKTVTVTSDKGVKNLLVKTTILPPEPAPMSGSREDNQQIAKADRQAVFKGDCARCHVEPTKNRMGKELFTAACGICHEAEHRATMVTDLHSLKKETNATYWRMWINFGKDASAMPAFATERGGPLNPEQVESLVDYLLIAFPSKPAAAN
jgi:hypothetical protein